MRFDPSSAAVRADPYPTYARLRAEDPVHRSGRSWYVSRYADVAALLRDPRFSSQRPGGPPPEGASESLPIAVLSRTMLSIDPPDHDRVRELVSPGFATRLVERLRPFIAGTVDDLLAPTIEAGRMEVIRDLAYPLPVIVTCEILGVPASDRGLFEEWSRGLTGLAEVGIGADAVRQGNESTRAFVQYFRALFMERRRRRGDDLLSALVAARDGGSPMTS